MSNRFIAVVGSCLSFIVAYIVGPVAVALAAPVMSFIRAAPLAAAFHFLAPAKLVAFRIIGALKPVYRDSYRTHGLSLESRSLFA
ncbi:hypothetical protein SAMN05892877_12377 [Rhizobium subbaraonis]|uniref:Uncharacterized protein n=1 Tax=Rhizobium subbaraonis TaxID=908946 RepID=A0A285UXZ4_9HYPH|nr:hypothetical protein [Rhizobium subbaraonis]SOC46653.1 hypothetical protein SAMN05892877_12377 [Rhizobium subbaraonis]